jgi:hypothetical protein
MTEGLQVQTKKIQVPRLTPTQVQELLPRLGLTYHEIARRVKKSDTTVRNTLLEIEENHFANEDTVNAIYGVIHEELEKATKWWSDRLKKAA